MANTINTRTMLTEQGALLPESLRFESEPWTSFYMAGETIRELRKALENKASMRAKATPGHRPKASERPEPEADRRDQEASSHMDDEGCLNERTATLPDATGHSRIGRGCC